MFDPKMFCNFQKRPKKPISFSFMMKWICMSSNVYVPVGVEVMTGACVSMSLMKSLVILSSSSTSLIFRGTPPPGIGTGSGGEGCCTCKHTQSH